MLMEPFGFISMPMLLLQYPALMKLPQGNGEPVMLLPGFTWDDKALYLMRRFLNRKGYKAMGWGLGVNGGNVEETLPKVIQQIKRQVDKHEQPINLVGWSLGGYLSREAARDEPELVKQVITFGSPVIGGPKYTTVAKSYAKLGFDVDRIEKEIEKRWEVPISVPITTIYSKLDNIVAWEAQMDHLHDHTEHFEVKASHISLGFSPEVFRIVVTQLAKNLAG